MLSQNRTYDAGVALTANAFEKTGYKFLGWNTVSTATTVEFVGGFTGNLSETAGATVELYAIWAPIEYTVTFDKNHASATGDMSDQNRTYGAGVALTENAFVRTGYRFLGWNTNSTATTVTVNDEYAGNLSAIDGDTVTLFAIWQRISYTITFNLNGGNALITPPTAYDITTVTITLPTPTRTGYRFGGWFDNVGFAGTAVTQIVQGSTGDKEFWARWNENTYVVEFHGNNSGTDTMADQNFTYDQVATALSTNVFTRIGYTGLEYAGGRIRRVL
jgi:uncharacterized repeat protein (TIGR02543 family)